MNITISKQHEGSIIYGLGTGNNARRSGPTEPIEFKVIKVKRKYVELKQGDRVTDNYNPETGATQSAINSGYCMNAGYLFFESIADIKNHNQLLKKKANIDNFFRGYGTRLTPDQVNKIHDIIF